VSGTGLTPVTGSVAWNVHNLPQPQAPRARTGMTGGPQLAQVRAPDGLPGCTLTFTATGLPPGLSMSPCGLISGLLSKAGSYDPVISVSDSSGSVLAAVPFGWQVRQPAGTGPSGPVRLDHSRLCLGRTGSGIGLVPCRKGPAQSWTFTQYGAITLARHCLASGRPTQPLRLRSCKGTVFQRWQLRSDGLIASVQSGDCVAAAGRKAGAAASVAACDGDARELWRGPAGPLYSALPGFCASSWEPARVAAGPVRLRECRGGRATTWSVEPDGTLRSGGRCLALTFPAVAGASVVVAGCDGRASERWQVFGGPLAVEILSPQAGLCLAVPGDQPLSPSLALGACTTTDPGATWRLS
jgi:hypothetical protein